MNNKKKIIKPILFGFLIPTIVSIVLGQINEIGDALATHNRLFVSLLFAFFFIAIVGWIIVIKSNRNKIDLDDFFVQSSDNNRYKIILVDDDANIRMYWKKKFKNYDITDLPKIDCVEMLYGFDIIILDIEKASNLCGENTLPIIKSLAENKPYKYVIAFSGQDKSITKCKDAGFANDTAKKTDTLDDLKIAIDKAFSKLDYPATYWSCVEEKVKVFPQKDSSYIERIKLEYFTYLNSNCHFKKK